MIVCLSARNNEVQRGCQGSVPRAQFSNCVLSQANIAFLPDYQFLLLCVQLIHFWWTIHWLILVMATEKRRAPSPSGTRSQVGVMRTGWWPPCPYGSSWSGGGGVYECDMMASITRSGSPSIVSCIPSSFCSIRLILLSISSWRWPRSATISYMLFCVYRPEITDWCNYTFTCKEYFIFTSPTEIQNLFLFCRPFNWKQAGHACAYKVYYCFL